jgi:hypothetical protein
MNMKTPGKREQGIGNRKHKFVFHCRLLRLNLKSLISSLPEKGIESLET